MATERLPMRKIREVLRLRWQLELTVREAAASVGVSVGVVQKTAARAATARALTWAGGRGARRRGARGAALRATRRAPAMTGLGPTRCTSTRELRRVGVTLELLHLEYLEQHPTGFDTRRSASATGGGCATAGRRDAPGAQGRREVLRRLLGQEAAHRRPEDRRA